MPRYRDAACCRPVERVRMGSKFHMAGEESK